MRLLARLSLPVAIAAALAAAACNQSSTASKAAATAEPATTATASAPPAATSAAPTPTASAEPSAAPSASVAAAPAPKATASGKSPSAPASAAAPERKVKTVGGTSQSGEGFSVGISAQSPVRAGKSGSASIVLTAKDPYHCNPKYPYKMSLDAPTGGVSYPQNPVRGMSVNGKRASMAVPFTASQKGKATVSGTLSLSVCTADKCLIQKRKLSVTVDVD